MKSKFEDASGKLKKINTYFANLTFAQKAGLIFGIIMLQNAIVSVFAPMSLQTRFSMAVKDHKPVWTTARAAYKGNYFCASNAASFATTQVLQPHTLEEIKAMKIEDFLAKASPFATEELRRIPECEGTTLIGLDYHIGEISPAPVLDSPSIGLD